MERKVLFNDKKSQTYEFFARNSAENIFSLFKSSKRGLTNQQASLSREEFGENIITHGKKTPLIVEIIKAYFTPFTIVLIILAAISFVTDYVIAAPGDKDLVGVLIIVAMVLISGTMTLIQSVKSNQAAEKLNNMVQVTATVVRRQNEVELPIEEIVCGDLVKLSAGDMIPADIRLTKTKDLFVSQSVMTGESYPVEKRADYKINAKSVETEYENIVFMGSNVISGSAEGVVVSVGDNTLFGKVAQDVSEKIRKQTLRLGLAKLLGY